MGRWGAAINYKDYYSSSKKDDFILRIANFFLAKAAASCHNNLLLPVMVRSPLCIIEEEWKRCRWRRWMLGLRKFAMLLVPAFVICWLLLGGCNGPQEAAKPNVPGPDKVGTTAADLKKVSLLKELDRKFENPDAHYELGELYQADGLWSKAEYHYNITLSFAPAHRPAQAAMVRVLQGSGNTGRAKVAADLYINQVSGSAEESLKLGMAFAKQQFDDYALACYQQALNLAPNSAKINRQMGYYYLSKKDLIRAKEYLTRSFQLDPVQPDVAGELGRLGVAVRVPRKTETQTKRLDKIVEGSGEVKK
jgi:tetratricopeptide (TPR) repeat protein